MEPSLTPPLLERAGPERLILVPASLIKLGIYVPPTPRSMALQIIDKQSAFASRFSSGLLFRSNAAPRHGLQSAIHCLPVVLGRPARWDG